MSSAYHPLRPKEDSILVCEGQTDATLLSGVFSNIEQANQILVYWANGNKSVPTFSSILSPSIYVIDRDFSITSGEARETLVNRKRRTVWPCVDIESYLLQTDWLGAFVSKVQSTSLIRIKHVGPPPLK